jgi:hypothetical protein
MPRTKEISGEHYEIAYERGAINELSARETVSKMKAKSALGKRNGANACPEISPLLQQTANDQIPVAIDLYELRDPYELYTRCIDKVCTLLRYRTGLESLPRPHHPRRRMYLPEGC